MCQYQQRTQSRKLLLSQASSTLQPPAPTRHKEQSPSQVMDTNRRATQMRWTLITCIRVLKGTPLLTVVTWSIGLGSTDKTVLLEPTQSTHLPIELITPCATVSHAIDVEERVTSAETVESSIDV